MKTQIKFDLRIVVSSQIVSYPVNFLKNLWKSLQWNKPKKEKYILFSVIIEIGWPAFEHF